MNKLTKVILTSGAVIIAVTMWTLFSEWELPAQGSINKLEEATSSVTDAGRFEFYTLYHDDHRWIVIDGPRWGTVKHHPDCLCHNKPDNVERQLILGLQRFREDELPQPLEEIHGQEK